MSQVGRYAAPLVVAGALLAVAGVAVVSSSAATKRYPVHTLTTSDRTKVVQTFDGKSFHARVGNAPLKDGTHRLTNGGAIRVRGGVIVWDAFGVVERSKRQGLAATVDPTG